MKKTLVLLIAICLFGCARQNKFEELGYSPKHIEIIESYPEEYQALFLGEYNAKLISLMEYEDFDISKAQEYLKYYGKLDNSIIIESLNNNEDINRLIEIYDDEFFLEKNKQIYLDNLDKYSTVRECIEAVNTKSYLPYYTDVQYTDLSKNYLILVNKYNKLAEDYVPEDLVPVEPKYGRHSLRAEVYEKYKQLQDDASELGYHFTICSGYRDYELQDYLYNKYLQDEGGNVEKVDTYSARPGHSEHQSGLCADLYDSVYGMDDFGLSEASKWLNENCYKYGFIIRYTKEKEKVTGYQAEPWQIRYVGSNDIAKFIMDKGISFDEYYACYVE